MELLWKLFAIRKLFSPRSSRDGGRWRAVVRSQASMPPKQKGKDVAGVEREMAKMLAAKNKKTLASSLDSRPAFRAAGVATHEKYKVDREQEFIKLGNKAHEQDALAANITKANRTKVIVEEHKQHAKNKENAAPARPAWGNAGVATREKRRGSVLGFMLNNKAATQDKGADDAKRAARLRKEKEERLKRFNQPEETKDTGGGLVGMMRRSLVGMVEGAKGGVSRLSQWASSDQAADASKPAFKQKL